MRVLVTGSQGFIGKNLMVRLAEMPQVDLMRFDHGESSDELRQRVAQVDAVVHLAGVNRPQDQADFARGNTDLTRLLCQALQEVSQKPLLILASSIQAGLQNPYGQSKLAAEAAVEKLVAENGNPALVYRLPNVFGKWCKPQYNSVVATFCHNLTRGLPIQIDEATKQLTLVYVDDVVSDILDALQGLPAGLHRREVSPQYTISLGSLAAQLNAFRNSRNDLVAERVGTGLVRALYATYVSYMPVAEFSYPLTCHRDPRGIFVEMLKTPDCGQFSYFTAHPGVTRGGHYHHSKTEKFLVVKGSARFGFRHVLTQQTHEILTSGEVPTVVETIPGWSHDITNVGQDEMVVMLWANEIFNRQLPDTITSKV